MKRLGFFSITQGVMFGGFFLLFQWILVQKIPLQPSGLRIPWHRMLHGSCSALLGLAGHQQLASSLMCWGRKRRKAGKRDRNTEEQRMTSKYLEDLNELGVCIVKIFIWSVALVVV